MMNEGSDAFCALSSNHKKQGNIFGNIARVVCSLQMREVCEVKVQIRPSAAVFCQ